MTQQVQQLLSRLAGVSASLGVGAWVLSESLYNVDGGHAAIIWNRFGGGVQQYVMGEGSHFSALSWWMRAPAPPAAAAAFCARAQPPRGATPLHFSSHFFLSPNPAPLRRDSPGDLPHRF